MAEPTNIAIDIASDEVALADIAEQMADEYREHGAVDLIVWQQRFPKLASEIARLAPTLEVLAGLSSPASSNAVHHDEAADLLANQTLGDFRILRELGRGGMGIVYEAKQLSLNRCVALKILPMAAVLDPRTLQRFKNEAQAAAALDHPHIVDVYGIGCERGIHYYAMRLIDGCTLADVIARFHAQADTDPAKLPSSLAEVSSSFRPAELVDQQSPLPANGYNATTAHEHARSTAVGSGTRSWRLYGSAMFRSIAELGLHVAEGLHHAHEQGIVHRDIKPSNLMLDGSGQVWITDFGLAQIESNPGLTQTGDLLGTLRYMSPEQTLANRAPIDHRSDIYSFGATLYELLTLQPMFSDNSRATLLQKIALSEPAPPHKLNPRIPPDLETIILKMLEKEPVRRYASAADLALDLRRYLDNKPIVARRPSLATRLVKWSARNRTVVTLSAAMLLIVAMLTGGILGWWTRDRAAQKQVAERIATEAQQSAEIFRAAGNWPATRTELQRATAALATTGNRSQLAKLIEAAQRDVEMAIRLDEVRLLTSTLVGSDFDFRSANAAYQQAFTDYGIPITTTSAADAKRLIRRSTIRIELAQALSDWSLARQRMKSDLQPDWKGLLSIARDSDPDPWRSKLRKGWVKDDLIEMASSPALAEQPPATLSLFVCAATHQQANTEAMQCALRELQRRHPQDFWLNFDLGRYFEYTEPPQWDESVRYFSIAAALRPESGAVHSNLGRALHKISRRQEAIAEYRRAVKLSPTAFFPHANLGVALAQEGQFEESAAAFRTAMQLTEDTALVRRMILSVLPDGELPNPLREDLTQDAR